MRVSGIGVHVIMVGSVVAGIVLATRIYALFTGA